MPFWERTLYVAILTYLYIGHLIGLISVARRYNLISYETEILKNPPLLAKKLQDILAVKNLSAKYLKKGNGLVNQSNFKLEILVSGENLGEIPGSEAENLDPNGFLYSFSSFLRTF